MTVAELITLLQTCIQDHRVVVSGYEGGYRDIGEIVTQDLALNVNKEWYYGPHDDPKDSEVPDEQAYRIC